MKTAEYDLWRAEYPMQTVQGHAALYNKRFLERPGIGSWSGRAVRMFLNQHGNSPLAVAEIGGRDGDLAKVALESTPKITKWINYEISDEPIKRPVTMDARYEGRLMTDFCWWEKTIMEGDVLVLSHIIEHLSDEHFSGLVGSIPRNIKGVHAQAPLPMRGPTDWKGYFGAHILSMGWVEVNDVFVAHGFKSVPAYDGASWFRR